MKKLLIIGAVALVVVGCVLAAGCTSSTSSTTTTEDFAVGLWCTDDGKTSIILKNDNKGLYTDLDTTQSTITWKKTADGKYQVTLQNGTQVVWTLDKNKGTMTNTNGIVLTKKNYGTKGDSVNEVIPPYPIS